MNPQKLLVQIADENLTLPGDSIAVRMARMYAVKFYQYCANMGYRIEKLQGKIVMDKDGNMLAMDKVIADFENCSWI